MATSKQRLEALVKRLSNRTGLERVRQELEQREGRAVSLSEIQGKVDRLQVALSQADTKGAKKRNFTPEDFTGQGLTREQQFAKAERLNRIRTEEEESFQNLTEKELDEILSAQRDPEVEQAGQQPNFLERIFGQTQGVGRDVLQDLTQAQVQPSQREQIDNAVLGSEVSTRERELRDEAALAIANGADPVAVNQRLNKLLQG